MGVAVVGEVLEQHLLRGEFERGSIMIPKVIHYCWFGGNPLTELAEKCIESWKKFCPDYEIVRWDETNFDVNQNDYCREAYESKKWAFVSDYARLKVLYEYGGIYMDTDVEVTKNLDLFLKHNAFSGFEDEKHIPTGIMASEKDGIWMNLLLSYYDDRHFALEDGSYDLTTNVTSITDMTMKKYPLLLNNQFQETDGVYTLYPSDFFCPKNHYSRELKLTENTHTIHHFDGSWFSDEDKYAKKLRVLFSKYLNIEIARILAKVFSVIKHRGFKGIITEITSGSRG